MHHSPDPRGQVFSCTQCGQCCRGYGGTYVTEADILAIARFLGQDPAGFVSRHCADSGGRPVLAQKEDGFCAFFEGNCSIHPVKPAMCRRWPFLPAVLTDPGNWSAMARSCPGILAEAPPEQVAR
ncbi:MAG: YkgJ family cysteine cluster protein, partial [Proteobacteria bacterium]|nr:YkgJ family cysteine cluster protein [Pseudomonadota bacterium]